MLLTIENMNYSGVHMLRLLKVKIFSILFLISIIFFFPLFSYSTDDFIEKDSHDQYELDGGHYNYYYINGKMYKKYNKPTMKEKTKIHDKLMDGHRKSTEYKSKINREEQFNIKQGNEVKMKFSDESNMQLEYDRYNLN